MLGHIKSNMKTGVIKTGLKNWQEIIFTISIGVLLIEITRNNMVQNTIDGWDIALLFLIVPLLICLIGQFYWNNKTLSIILSVILSIGSFIFILMALYYLSTTNSKLFSALSMLIFGLFLFIAGLTMTRKNKRFIRT